MPRLNSFVDGSFVEDAGESAPMDAPLMADPADITGPANPIRTRTNWDLCRTASARLRISASFLEREQPRPTRILDRFQVTASR